MKKKLIALLLALALVFACTSALVACNETPEKDNAGDNTGDGNGDKKDNNNDGNTGENTGDNTGDTKDPDPLAGVTDANYETFVTSVSGGVLKINLIKVTYNSDIRTGTDDQGNPIYKTVRNTVTLRNGEIGVTGIAGEGDTVNKVLRFSIVVDVEGEGISFEDLTGPITLSGQLGTDNVYLLVTDAEGKQQALYGDTPGVIINALELIKSLIPDDGGKNTPPDTDGNTGDTGSGNTGDTGSGNTGDTGSGDTGDTGSGNTGDTSSGNTGDTDTGNTETPAMPTYVAVIKDLINKLEASLAENGITLPETGELDPETAKKLASTVKTIATGYFKVEKDGDGRKYTFDPALLKAAVDALGNTELVDLLGGEEAFTTVIAMPATVLNMRVKEIIQLVDSQLEDGMTVEGILTMVNATINSYLEESFGAGVTIEAMLGITDTTLAELIMSDAVQKMTVRALVASLTGKTEDDIDNLVDTVISFLVANKHTTVYGFVAMIANQMAKGDGSGDGTGTVPTELTADDIAKAVNDIFESYINNVNVTVTVGADGTLRSVRVSAEITAGEVEVSVDLAFVANGTLEGNYDSLVEDALKVGQNIGTPTPETDKQ